MLVVLVVATVALAGMAAVGGVHGAEAALRGPLYGGVGGRGAPSVSVLQGLPQYSPSTMPTRFYDSTEYDVAPFVTPFRLPTPPPPPSLLETNAAAATMGQAGNAASIQAAAQAAAMAAARGGAQAQAQQQVRAAPAVPRTPLMRYHQQLQQQMMRLPQQQVMRQPQPMQQQMPVSLLQAAAHVHHRHAQKASGKARHHAHQRHNARHHSRVAAQAAAQRAFEQTAGRMRFHRSVVDEEQEEEEQQEEEADEQEEEEESSEDADEEQEEEAAAAPVSLMETAGKTLQRGASMHRSRAELEMANAALQSQLARMQSAAAAFQRQREAQTAYLNAAHEQQRAASMAARPQQPFLAEAPESIAARGYVPHFAPLVRALPTAQPVQPYAGFFEAAAQTSSASSRAGIATSGPFAGRPQEPFLPRLPPPPVVLGEY